MAVSATRRWRTRVPSDDGASRRGEAPRRACRGPRQAGAAPGSSAEAPEGQRLEVYAEHALELLHRVALAGGQEEQRDAVVLDPLAAPLLPQLRVEAQQAAAVPGQVGLDAEVHDPEDAGQTRLEDVRLAARQQEVLLALLLAEGLEHGAALLQGLRGGVVHGQRDGPGPLAPGVAGELGPLEERLAVTEEHGLRDVDHVLELRQRLHPALGLDLHQVVLDELLDAAHLLCQIEHVLFAHQGAFERPQGWLGLRLHKGRQDDVPQRGGHEQAEHLIDLAHLLHPAVGYDLRCVVEQERPYGAERDLLPGGLQHLQHAGRMAHDDLGTQRPIHVGIEILRNFALEVSHL
mmetsp:Transcript_18015/g.48318  ORF Transcript_18015/g.48318 Transcript_18015/m.48318 type:complete len:348 (-) Transcript_18015:495-1538(-)